MNQMISYDRYSFGYPDTVIREFTHWVILLRKPQVTFGSLILLCKEDVENYSDVSKDAMKNFRSVIRCVEKSFFRVYPVKKFNYLMLRMVDPEIHFHVFPRYDSLIQYSTTTFEDVAWPKPIDLSLTLKIPDSTCIDICQHLRRMFLNYKDEE
jgi:diadenosine tetraphosphate (Ap4A) HIT family hydrolase